MPGGLPPYLEAHIERVEADIHPHHRYTCLSVSENKIVWDLLSEKVNTNRNVPQSAMEYGARSGNPEFVDAVADFGSRHVWGTEVGPDEVVTMAGAGTVVETLAATLCARGEAVLVPTPTYAVYWLDIQSRFGVHAVSAPMSFDHGFRLSVDRLAEACDQSPHPVRTLLLTTPSNPVGRIEPMEDIVAAVEWARSRGMHVVINELYALTAHGPTRWVSAASGIEDLKDDVHLMWGFSKDFAASGLRSGVLFTRNEDVRAAATHHAIFGTISGDTQHLLTTMMADDEWNARYLQEMRSRLADARTEVESVLSRHGLSSVPADAGLFLVADLRPLLSDQTWDAEHTLWRTMMEIANVNLTPGSACRFPDPGFMRICFATAPTPQVVDAVDRALTAAHT